MIQQALLHVAPAVVLLVLASSAMSEEITYRNHIQPVWERQCAPCHGDGAAPEYRAYKENPAPWEAANKGMRMDTYSHLAAFTAWPNTGALMRRLNDGTGAPDGKPGNMYENLGATEEERQRNLALFKQWVGAWTLKRWKDVSKDELDGIKVKY